MPRLSKLLRGEVKPSKFKTSLCQFYKKGEVCPFAERCAFAHGEHELRSEQENLTVHFLQALIADPTEGADS